MVFLEIPKYQYRLGLNMSRKGKMCFVLHPNHERSYLSNLTLRFWSPFPTWVSRSQIQLQWDERGRERGKGRPFRLGGEPSRRGSSSWTARRGRRQSSSRSTSPPAPSSPAPLPISAAFFYPSIRTSDGWYLVLIGVDSDRAGVRPVSKTRM